MFQQCCLGAERFVDGESLRRGYQKQLGIFGESLLNFSGHVTPVFEQFLPYGFSAPAKMRRQNTVAAGGRVQEINEASKVLWQAE